MHDNNNSNFFLDFSICKSIGSNKTDSNGNYIFEVEASNENIDLQNQIVLQNALMESKDNFLKKGVISWDHQHKTRDENGDVKSNPEMIIGEPIDVWTDGKSTFVRGILYKSNEIAKDLIQKLKDGSTRIRASVGGIFPKIKKMANGVEEITSVLWNDLALTTSPVNNTVENAVFAKSLNATEFIDMYKSLNAGYGTDSALMTDGRALISEDISNSIQTITTTNIDNSNLLLEEANTKTLIDSAKESLIEALSLGFVTNYDEALEFLKREFNLNEIQSLAVADDIITNGGNQGMAVFKGQFANTVDQIFKSFKKNEDKNAVDDFEKSEKEDEQKNLFSEDDFKKSEDDDDDESFSVEDEEDTSNDEEDDNDKKVEKGSCKKSLTQEDSEVIDAFEILKSLKDEIQGMHDSMNEIKKSLADANIKNAELESKINQMSNEPLPMNSVISKSLNPTSQNVCAPSTGKPTTEDFFKARDILCKSVKEGKLDLMKSTVFEHEIQMAMNGGKMSDECYNFICQNM